MKRKKAGREKKKELYGMVKAEQKRRRREYAGFCDRLFEDVSITADVSGEPLLSLAGRHCLLVQNYHSIAEYTKQRVRLKTGRYDLIVEGDSLAIVYSLTEELKIKGEIAVIYFGKAPVEL